MSKFNADINSAGDCWIQVTISGETVNTLTEAQIASSLSTLPIAGEGKAEEQVQQEECDYHRAAEADFQNHVNYLRRAREWE